LKNLKSKIITNPVRVLFLTMLVLALTFGSGGTAQAASGQAVVDLRAAAPFVILSQSGVTNVPTSAIVGNLGVSPIASTAITGFALVLHSTKTYSTSTQVKGKIYAASYASPTPSMLTSAISNMQAAYNDAAGRKNPNFTELHAGNLTGKTLKPGLYKWGTGVLINGNVTLSGSSSSVWIFQIAGTLTMGSGAKVILSGGAQAKNVFWQVAGAVTIGTYAHMEGTLLAKTNIALQTGASLNGRALAQTAVTLDKNKVTIPSTSSTRDRD